MASELIVIVWTDGITKSYVCQSTGMNNAGVLSLYGVREFLTDRKLSDKHIPIDNIRYWNKGGNANAIPASEEEELVRTDTNEHECYWEVLTVEFLGVKPESALTFNPWRTLVLMSCRVCGNLQTRSLSGHWRVDQLKSGPEGTITS